MEYEIEWKRVKDELPPEGKKVLLQLENECKLSSGYRLNCYRFYVDCFDDDCQLNEVYAWCSLPKLCPVKHDVTNKIVSSEQFVGCLCDVLIKLGKLELHKDVFKWEFDKVFAELYNNNIVADFHLDFTLDYMLDNGFGDIFSINQDTIQVKEKTYKEEYREHLIQGLDAKVKEKLEKILNDYFNCFLDKNELFPFA